MKLTLKYALAAIILVLSFAASVSAPQEQTLVPRGSEKPSFNCAQAKTAAARLICGDAELARLDGELGIAFQKRKAQISSPDQSKLVAEQLAWIRDRNARCELVGKNTAAIEVLASSKPCMVTAIRERIAFLAQADSVAARAAQTAPQPPTPTAESNLSKVFKFDMLNAQVAYFESIIGPAMHTYSDSPAGVQIRDYRVDGCEVQALTEGAEVLRYSLALTPTCNFDLGKVLVGYSSTRGLTVGKFFSGSGGMDIYVRSDCVYSCGNAVDPTVDFIWQGPHSSN